MLNIYIKSTSVCSTLRKHVYQVEKNGNKSESSVRRIMKNSSTCKSFVKLLGQVNPLEAGDCCNIVDFLLNIVDDYMDNF